MDAAIEQGVAWQIRLNREFRGMSQRELAKLLGTQQSAVSRLEDPSYGNHSLETLAKIAKIFDCALSVKFVSYSQLAYESERLGEAEQCAMPFETEWSDIDGYQENESPRRPDAVLHGRHSIDLR
ncbi:helix-turn-helix domain-containing protein [Hydrogenophaga sp. BPS33]|uniref:helix-turn-helix domain-containing protein n=1 Tax=Hydrogenophaga sp. BPS33 TaxID=2651974 RepID=UPI00131F8391|nr:helix-turn-helix transcriptional regulator [Hydrogenophaga sp. BPS33]